MSNGLTSMPESQFAARVRAFGHTANSAAGQLIIEDGWVFREHHGKYVECLCRTNEMPYLDTETQNLDKSKIQPGHN